jgi:ATP-binding cassette, subfamily B, multidrug efflux pump
MSRHRTSGYTRSVKPLPRLIGYVDRYRRLFVLGLMCAAVNKLIALAGPLVLSYAVDDLQRAVTRGKLFAYGSVLLGIGVVSGAFLFLSRKILIGASRHIEYDMRNEFFAHLQTLPLSYFQANRTGDLMSRATNDLNAVRMMIGPAIMYSANTILVFFVAVAVMAKIDARLTLIALIPLPFVSISVKYFGSAIHRRFERIQSQLSDISAVAQEALSGVRVVRAYRQEQSELDRFRSANAEYLRRNRGLIALQGLFFPSMAFFLGLGALLILWIGSREVIVGRITVGQFVAFNSYLAMLSWPMIAFGWVTNMLQRGMASWKRMLEVLDADADISDFRVQSSDSGRAAGVSRIAGIRGEIEFRDLTFRYGDTLVLDRISLRIEAGETVALVGVTGSGKSTLISLLARLHDPPRGAVFVDGVDVLDIPLATLRGAVGFVPQEPFLFSDTLADNVAFGLDGERAERAGGAGAAGTVGREERILHAAAVSRLDKDVADFPDGYETMVGERGITLSGGQKQRTALARAVAIDPRILILDDSLSAVDTYTEEEILTRLRTVLRGRTSILVSHRISTVRDAERIFVLDGGRIVERGSHEELIKIDGLYAALHKKQLLEEELAAS